MASLRKPLAVAGLFFALAAGAADAPAKLGNESVIYPRNAPEAGRSVSRPDDGFPLWGLLTAMVVLGAGGFYLMKRGGVTGRSGGVSGQRLAIEETRPLGNKLFLAVATYGERKLLLAVCPGRIDLLCRLDDGEKSTPEKSATAASG